MAVKEVWKDVKGYEGLYKVSNKGKVSGIRCKGEMKTLDNGNGYKSVTLCKDGVHKRMYVHRLVAIAFLPNPNGYPQVNHKDENKANNALSNLEWCDQKYNSNYGTLPKRQREGTIKRQGRACRCIETGKEYRSLIECAEDNGVTISAIYYCCRDSKQAVGLHFEYIEQ